MPPVQPPQLTCQVGQISPADDEVDESSGSFSGVFPPIVTPFASNQSVAWDKLEENLSKLNTEPLAGYLVHGSNGEFCYLDTRERLEMVKTVRGLCGPDKLLLAGSGAESTLETVRMTEAMAAAGADVAVVVTPSYYKG